MKQMQNFWLAVVLIAFSSTLVCSQAKQEKNSAKAGSVTMATSQEIIDIIGTWDKEKKEADVIELVEKALSELASKERDEAFYQLNWSDRFKKGELYIFVHSVDGVIWVQGDEHKSLLWKDVNDLQDQFGDYFIRGLREAALAAGEKGAWYSYQWNGATKKAYVRIAEKDGKKYVVGSGYYPASKLDYAISFVKRAVATFNSSLKKGIDKEILWGQFTYPEGDFIYGDLYLYVLDQSGVEVADGGVPEQIGVNISDMPDTKGDYFVRKIINGLLDKPLGEGIQVEYYFKGAVKIAYAERIVDNEGNNYFIAAGFWPGTNRDEVTKLVRKGVNYLKDHTAKEAAQEFAFAGSLFKQSEFMLGDLYLVAFDDEGLCLANGMQTSLIGKNILYLQDEDGHYIIRDILSSMKDKDSAWFEFRKNKAFWSVYVEKMLHEDKQLFVMSGFYPVSKTNAAMLLVKSAGEALRKRDMRTVFRQFASDKSNFIRGDLQVLVMDMNGFCFVDGLNRSMIWKHLTSLSDKNSAVFKKIIAKAQGKRFGEIFSEKGQENGVPSVYICQKIEKDAKAYVICTNLSM